MRSKFDNQLKLLNEEMFRMCSMIEYAIRSAMRAFMKMDIELARKTMKGDEEVDKEQKKIEGICFDLLIRQQPVARDLRTITAAMKMVTDMERIGDQAADISEITIALKEKPTGLKEEHLNRMASEVIVMLIHAIEAYAERDIEKAKAVIEHDEVIDELFLEVRSDLIEFIRNNRTQGDKAADLLMVNKYLERIGDHATNIAEWVIFSAEDHIGGKE